MEGKHRGKMLAETTLHQPSTGATRNPDGPAKHLAAEVNFCIKLHLTSPPWAQLPSQKSSFQFERREVGKGGGSYSIHTLPPLSGPLEIQSFF